MELFDDDEFRTDALFAYTLSIPGETSSGRVRALMTKVEQAAGGFRDDEEDLVRIALDQRLMLHGKSPVFFPDEEEEEEAETVIAPPKPGRNDLCSCGSGKKFKKCHGAGELRQNRSMRCLLLLVTAFALIAASEMPLTVAKLTDFIRSAAQIKQPDKQVAETLRHFKMVEKLDDRTIEELQSLGAGPKTVAALKELGDASASLPEAAAARASAGGGSSGSAGFRSNRPKSSMRRANT